DEHACVDASSAPRPGGRRRVAPHDAAQLRRLPAVLSRPGRVPHHGVLGPAPTGGRPAVLTHQTTRPPGRHTPEPRPTWAGLFACLKERIMSKETLQHLNTNTLIGNTTQRGTAWHYRADLQGGEPNHYAGPIPVEDVRRRLFDWTAQSRPLAVALPSDLAHATNLGQDGAPYRW